MGFIIILLIVAAVIYFKLSCDPAWVKELCKGKTDEQKKVIRYFVREGCLANTMKDADYDAMVRQKATSFDFKQKALDKHGIDIDQVQEIEPVNFEGYVFDNKSFAKKGDDGSWRSSKYQITWIFFSDAQVYFYQYTFNMDEATKRESTDEYFYKDIVNFSSASSTEEVTEYSKSGEKKLTSVDANIFQLVVPGDKIACALKLNNETENVIKGMKNKLREKKS